VVKCSTKNRAGQTRRYEALCAHYGMEPTRNNRGVAHEKTAASGSGRRVIGALTGDRDGDCDDPATALAGRFCAWGDVGSAADKVQEVERQPFGFAVIGAEK
jgi:hypothetical protein